MAPMPANTTHLLYLHGFRSSPQSMKAQKVAARVAARHPGVTWWCPQLPPSPREAMAQVLQGVAAWPHERMAVIGSSLGGYYARVVAEQTGCKTVLLNPAVHPARDLQRHIGEQSGWHAPHEHFYFQAHFVDELRALDPGPLSHPQRCYAIIAQGDEVLDWREMCASTAGAHLKLLPASDHALSDFDAHIDDIFAFLNLA